MSHLATRKIIFKCAFFRGDVSSQEGRFSAVLGPQKQTGPDLIRMIEFRDFWTFSGSLKTCQESRDLPESPIFFEDMLEPNTSRSGVSLGGGFKYFFYFHSYLEKMIPILTTVIFFEWN